MTREEAIKQLEYLSVCSENHVTMAINSRDRQAIDMAIEALSCSELPNSSDSISRKVAIDELIKMLWDCFQADEELVDAVVTTIKELPSAQPYFDITVKIDKAYDDGYEAGYLQGRHDWGDLDG